MKIKSYEEGCKIKGSDPKKSLPNVSGMPVEYRKPITATAKLYLIADVLNARKVKGKIIWWKPDWNDSNQPKWTGWFWMNKPGFRLCDSYCDLTDARTSGGSRLCFRTEEDFLYAVKHFLDLFRDMMGSE